MPNIQLNRIGNLINVSKNDAFAISLVIISNYCGWRNVYRIQYITALNGLWNKIAA